jgi:PAS domain S-box-containing protein
MSVYPNLLNSERATIRVALAERLEKYDPEKAALAMQYVANDLEDLLDALQLLAAVGDKNLLRLWVARQSLASVAKNLPFSVVLCTIDHLGAVLRGVLLERVLVEELPSAFEEMEFGIAQLRKRYTESHFATQQAQLHALADQSDSFLCLTSLGGKPHYINAKGRELIGLPADAPANSTSLKYFHSEASWNLIRATIVPQLNDLGQWTGAGQLKNLQTGQPIDVQMNFQLLRDEATNKPISLACFHRPLGVSDEAREQEDRKIAILESALDPIVTVDHEGKITEFNRAAERTFGLSRETALGQRPEQLLFSPFDRTEQQGRIERYVSMREGSMLGKRTEISAVRANGDIFPAEMAMTISREKGQPVFTFFLRDLSERKKAEQDLRDSEALYHSLVEGLPMNVFRKDLKGRFTFGNQRFCESLNLSLRQLIGKTDFDFFDRDLADKFRSDDKRVLDQREDFETVEEQHLPDGKRAFVHVRKSPVYDAQNRIVGIQGIFWDVTTSHLAEERLRESEQRLQAIMDNTTSIIYVKDLEGRYILANHSWEIIFGIERSQILGKTDKEIFEPEISAAFQANDQQVLRSGLPLQCEEKAPSADGMHTYLSVKFPLRDGQGEINALCGISTDITDRIKSEFELRKSKDAAEAASRAKSAFLANMSHEIRTPLNAVIGMTEMVLDSQLEPEQRDYLRMVRDSGDALLTVINDVLDFSKIEAGKMDLEYVEFPLRESVSTAIRSLALRAKTQGLDLTCHVAEDVPEYVVGDPGRLRQVLLNLVGNAIKFTEHGQVSLHVGAVESSDSNLTIRFAVRDTGIGIPVEKQVLIFAAFEQADSSMTRRFGGTGLGLAISAKLVELMGGKLTVNSEVGVGSTFQFDAEFIPATGEPAELREPPLELSEFSVGSLRILLAEDSLVNQKLAVGLLEKRGHEVTVVGNGKQALEAALHGQFDLVLMDVQMPEMDGLEATAIIRKDELNTERHLPIIAMTAYAMKGDRRRCLEAGMDSYVAKPIRANELFATIEYTLAALRAGRPVGLAAEPAEESWPHNKAPEEFASGEASSNGNTHAQKPSNGHERNGERPLNNGKYGSGSYPIVDWKTALSAVQGDRELLQDVVSAFLEEYQDLTVEIRTALEKQDAKTVRRVAHTIKGSMRCFAAHEACEAAYALECHGRNGEKEAFEAGWQHLVACVEEVLPQLQAFVADVSSDTDVEPSPADATS